MNDKNYITPAGLRTLRAELKKLKSEERPQITETIAWAAGNGDRSENGDYIYGKKRLREIDKRIRFLLKRIESAEVIDPLQYKDQVVRFGATVTILDEEDRSRTYSIVGIDESDLSRGRISWQSPLARALLKRQAGDTVIFSSPKGEQEVELVEVQYLPIED